MGANKKQRLGEKRYNYQGCLMKIIEYNHCRDIIVEFQDNYKAKVHANYEHFLSNIVRNPYIPSVYGVGITGNKYKVKIDNKITKEYLTWKTMLKRCFDLKYKEKHPTYKDATCCDEWLLFDNFYEWLHSQENFSSWLNGDKWAIDKDILIKGNKIYSPETCCLVPQNVNSLFLKGDSKKGNLPIGVTKTKCGYQAKCRNSFIRGKVAALGTYTTPEDAFQAYKAYKEKIIKQVAEVEHNKGNITEKCYKAMMNYIIEIND